MIICKRDNKFKFVSFFNTNTGEYVRTGILNELGKDIGVDPFMATMPELIDIGIMGKCKHGLSGMCQKSGIQCYQKGAYENMPNMNIEDYKTIIDQVKGYVFQVALGGRGDPDQHENIEEILKYTRENNIVPNFTTSGYELNEHKAKVCREYCGAVAVSWYEQSYTYRAIELLLGQGVRTNIHFVVDKNTIDKAIKILSQDIMPKGIEGIIFLLHKPVGQGVQDNILNYSDEKVKRFFELVDNNRLGLKLGFDSCFVPGLLNFTKNIDYNSVDTCEAGRWSCYISSDMKMMPCSFAIEEDKWKVDLKKHSIKEAWNSKPFDNFREILKRSCEGCDIKELCLGGCPLNKSIVLCNRKEKR